IVDTLHIPFDRPFGQAKPISDFLVAKSRCDKSEYLYFTTRNLAIYADIRVTQLLDFIDKFASRPVFKSGEKIIGKKIGWMLRQMTTTVGFIQQFIDTNAFIQEDKHALSLGCEDKGIEQATLCSAILTVQQEKLGMQQAPADAVPDCAAMTAKLLPSLGKNKRFANVALVYGHPDASDRDNLIRCRTGGIRARGPNISLYIGPMCNLDCAFHMAGQKQQPDFLGHHLGHEPWAPQF